MCVIIYLPIGIKIQEEELRDAIIDGEIMRAEEKGEKSKEIIIVADNVWRRQKRNAKKKM